MSPLKTSVRSGHGTGRGMYGGEPGDGREFERRVTHDTYPRKSELAHGGPWQSKWGNIIRDKGINREESLVKRRNGVESVLCSRLQEDYEDVNSDTPCNSLTGVGKGTVGHKYGGRE